MLMTNVTDLRKNIKGILEQVIEEKTPAVIVQRSRPVAYLVDAESFNAMQGQVPYSIPDGATVLRDIARVRDNIARDAGPQPSSQSLIREFREGKKRD